MEKDLQQIIEALLKRLENVKISQNIVGKKCELSDIENKISSITNWEDSAAIEEIMRKKTSLSKTIYSIANLEKLLQDSSELLIMALEEEDFALITELHNNVISTEKSLSALELSSLFTNEQDYMSCFIEINAGAGGTDSQDWAELLLRMYVMYANKNGFSCQVTDRTDGEEAGIKQATISITGEMAYGYLKNENGVHRLVRISPFNANDKRQTSFASVFSYPQVSDNIDIEIAEKDLRIDVYRSSGPGGQSVNTTDSAVRITHMPSGIVAQSQNQRSQMQNRAEAMKMLKSKIYEMELKKQLNQKQAIEDNKTEISWGNQIRNYVMHPYKMVKDTRSSYETSQIQDVLDGNLNAIIESVLLKNAADKNANLDN